MNRFLILPSLLTAFTCSQSFADPLSDLAGSYRALVEDQIEITRSYTHKDPVQMKKKLTPMLNNLETADNLVTLIDAYLEGIYSPDSILSNLLNSRFKYLHHVKVRRELMLKEFTQTGTINKFNALPTNPQAVKQTKIPAEKERDPFGPHTFNYTMTTGNIDRYQIFNKLIVGIYQRHSLSDFSTQTKHLLSASVTLFPLLTGKTDDWSHPDAGVLIYDEDPKSLQAGKDFTYWESCIKEREYPVTLMNWGKHETTIITTAESMGQSTVALPYLGWLDFAPEEAGPSTEDFTPTVEMDKADSKPVLSTLPLVEQEEEFGEGGESSEENLSDSLEFIESPVLSSSNEEDSSEEGILFQSQDGGDSDEEAAVNSDGNTIHSASPELTKTMLKSQKKSKVVQRRKERDEARKREKRLQRKTLSTPQDSSTYLAPRGHRVLHTKGLVGAEPKPQVDLNLNNQKTLLKIFNPSRFHKVKYREFKSLWQSVNGSRSIKKPGSGGSHRALLNAHGDVVGSTFTHGGSHTYTNNSIKYIRDALINVGLGPDDLKIHKLPS